MIRKPGTPRWRRAGTKRAWPGWELPRAAGAPGLLNVRERVVHEEHVLVRPPARAHDLRDELALDEAGGAQLGAVLFAVGRGVGRGSGSTVTLTLILTLALALALALTLTLTPPLAVTCP